MFEIVCYSLWAILFMASGKLAVVGMKSTNDRLKVIGIGSLCSSVALAFFVTYVTWY